MPTIGKRIEEVLKTVSAKSLDIPKELWYVVVLQKGDDKMANRRPAGDGMVRRKKRGQWEGRITVGHKSDGKPIFRYVYGKTQKETLEKLHQRIEDYRGVELTEDSKMTLSEWLDRWLNEYMIFTIRESTWDSYASMIRTHVKPYLGDKPVAFITTPDVQRMYNKIKKDGRRKLIMKSVLAKTQKELLQKMKVLKEQFDGVDLSEEYKITLREWLERWINDYAKPTLRESTVMGYKKNAARICEYIGDKEISRITTPDIQRMYNHLRKNGRQNKSEKYGKGLAPATVRGIHMFLHEAMDAAERANLVPRNPTTGTTIPKLEKTEKNVFNDKQLEIFMNAIEKEPVWFDFFYLELTVGMRLGEITALKWLDFDEENKTLHVQRTVTRSEEGLKVGDTKTSTGNRIVRLPESTYQLLLKRKAEAVTEWIFPSLLDPTNHVKPSSAYHRLKEILEENDLPNLRFHDLRHTFATHALKNGVDPKTLSGILGHTNASFTLDTYTHITVDMKRNAAEVVTGFMSNIVGDEFKL